MIISIIYKNSVTQLLGSFFYAIVTELNSLWHYLWNCAHSPSLSIRRNSPKSPSRESFNCSCKRFNREKRVDLSKGNRRNLIVRSWRTYYVSTYHVQLCISAKVTAITSRYGVNSVFNRYESGPKCVLIGSEQICNRLKYERRSIFSNSL